MKKIRTNKKGFTLAELLIVVAIIGVLVAISIPIFTSQLEKARLATNQANARAAYAAVEAQYLDDDTKTGDFTYNVSDGKIATTAATDATEITGDDSTNIFNWKTTTTVGSSTLGKTVYKTWTLTVGTDGSVTKYKAK
ncbi:pilus assembly FimT family protein [Anaerolactibacter massiliensis]|uniref:pilus assembly FimT family protein n=1 Tax=Anaerolactibacter massiliensis TaxID=2044573 RepID=UPI000CF91613|nr:prepilin-type N-terminal cleavage/methylation domain-containing protein [Anaerolactibacter massiliensis]